MAFVTFPARRPNPDSWRQMHAGEMMSMRHQANARVRIDTREFRVVVVDTDMMDEIATAMPCGFSGFQGVRKMQESMAEAMNTGIPMGLDDQATRSTVRTPCVLFTGGW